MNTAKAIGSCALATLVALYTVGALSNGVMRHIVQTLPLWFPIVMGLRQREVSKWAALPCFAIWLALMILIWVFLLGWANIISGHFTPIEVALTLVSRQSEKFLIGQSRKFLLTAVRLGNGTNRDEPRGTGLVGVVEADS